MEEYEEPLIEFLDGLPKSFGDPKFVIKYDVDHDSSRPLFDASMQGEIFVAEMPSGVSPVLKLTLLKKKLQEFHGTSYLLSLSKPLTYFDERCLLDCVRYYPKIPEYFKLSVDVEKFYFMRCYQFVVDVMCSIGILYPPEYDLADVSIGKKVCNISGRPLLNNMAYGKPISLRIKFGSMLFSFNSMFFVMLLIKEALERMSFLIVSTICCMIGFSFGINY